MYHISHSIVLYCMSNCIHSCSNLIFYPNKISNFCKISSFIYCMSDFCKISNFIYRMSNFCKISNFIYRMSNFCKISNFMYCMSNFSKISKFIYHMSDFFKKYIYIPFIKFILFYLKKMLSSFCET